LIDCIIYELFCSCTFPCLRKDMIIFRRIHTLSYTKKQHVLIETTYDNGTRAARVQERFRPISAHRWHNYIESPKKRYLNMESYLLKQMVSQQTTVCFCLMV
jgi:hypothetical protein